MLNLLYFGRLDKEKGIVNIINTINHFANAEFLPIVIHVFGSGSYEKEIIELSKKYPQNILFYGFKPLEFIKNIANLCDYCLMPSLFLETFGLSALNAISRGLPVIGYKKGGMGSFVLDELNLNNYLGNNDEKLIALIQDLIDRKIKVNAGNLSKISQNYNKQKWMSDFDAISGDAKNIVIISDFISQLGGIETYINNVSDLLKDRGYNVRKIGSKGGKTKISRYISIFFSIFNILWAFKIYVEIKRLNPDIIRCHSVSRNLGRLPLFIINRSSKQRFMMYHDLGYFAPFPSNIQEEIQVPNDISWKEFSKDVSIIKKIPVLGKWISLKLIFWQLSKFDLHMVPSEFMEKYISNNINENKIKTLVHFIQK